MIYRIGGTLKLLETSMENINVGDNYLVLTDSGEIYHCRRISLLQSEFCASRFNNVTQFWCPFYNKV